MASDFGDLIRALCLLDANSSAGSRRAMAGALGIDLLLPDAAEKKASGKSADVGQPPRVPPAAARVRPRRLERRDTRP